MQRVSGGEGVQLQLVRATLEEAKQHQEDERQARLQAIHDAAGVCHHRHCVLLLFLLFHVLKQKRRASVQAVHGAAGDDCHYHGLTDSGL